MKTQKAQLLIYLKAKRDKQDLYSDKWLKYHEQYIEVLFKKEIVK